jgi:hypothetical protein
MSLSILLTLLVGQCNQELSRAWCGKPSASLWKDQLFVATNGHLMVAGGTLFRGTFSPYQERVHSPVKCRSFCNSQLTSLAKMEIRDDRVLLNAAGEGHSILPVTDTPALEDSDFGKAICRARGFPTQSALVAHFGAGNYRLLFPDHRKPDVPPPVIPVPGLASGSPEADFQFRASHYASAARNDVQIAGPKSVRFFHAYKDTLFVSVEPDYLNAWYRDKFGNVVENPPPPPDRELRTGRLPADFTEYFAAYRSAGRDYLVTPNGKVYVATAKGKAEVEVAVVWADSERKIAGVVQDPANDAVYGWGVAEGGTSPTGRFYVKFAPKPVAVPYKLTAPSWNDSSDAYLESYECARAFRAAALKK